MISNPIKIGLNKLRQRGARIVSVNPVRTGYSAIADEWLGIRPGTDGLFVFALIHELLRSERVDLDFLVRYTNAPWLVLRNPGGALPQRMGSSPATMTAASSPGTDSAAPRSTRCCRRSCRCSRAR